MKWNTYTAYAINLVHSKGRMEDEEERNEETK